MSLSQQEVAIATTILEAGVLTLPIVAILLQYASQSGFAERPEFQGGLSYHTLMLSIINIIVGPLVISIISSILFLNGQEIPILEYSFLDLSLLSMGMAAVSTGSLVYYLYKISEKSDTIRSGHEEISYQILGIDEMAEQLLESDESSEEDIEEGFRDYLMWIWREDPKVFFRLKEGLQDNTQAKLDEFSEDSN